MYLEPGNESDVNRRADAVVNLTKDIIRQDPAAKVILGGDLNVQLGRMHASLPKTLCIKVCRIK